MQGLEIARIIRTGVVESYITGMEQQAGRKQRLVYRSRIKQRSGDEV